MKGKRTERLIRIASRMLLHPSRQMSLTETAGNFGVSKTLVSDDIEIISEALQAEGVGSIVTDRGRSGGAYFIPSPSREYRLERLHKLAEILSVPGRLLPGGLVYYTDLLFDPDWASFLGFTMASLFEDKKPTVVLTSEVKGIPVAFFTSYAIGVPLAVCRFRNRPSDGPAVGVHFPTGNGDVRTMYLGTRFITSSSRVLVIDDFMRGGSTAAGMLLMAGEFNASVVGVGVFISSGESGRKTVTDYRSLLELSVEKGVPKLTVSDI
ncbi:MAG: pur operon repressor [Synergistaceae bacterium]|jgi:purine operon repressor|nr:pur operon repressor [Synergistaceae bacterium]